MGLFSSSKSTSTNTVNNFDQRQVNDASGGGVVGSGNSFNLSDSSTKIVNDPTVIGNSFDALTRSQEDVALAQTKALIDSLKVTAGTVERVNDRSLRTLDNVNDRSLRTLDNVNDRSLRTLDNVNARSLDTADNAIAKVASAGRDANQFARDAFSASGSLIRDVISASAAASDRASKSVSDAFGAAGDAISGNRQLTTFGLIGAGLLVALVIFKGKAA